MNVYLFIYFMILIWIRTIYYQICVNFMSIEKNEDNWTKEKYIKIKINLIWVLVNEIQIHP